MLELTVLEDLKALIKAFPTAAWQCKDRRIEDDTQKWVIYQAGFDAASDQRLEYICKVMNALPELLKAAELGLMAAANAEDSAVTKGEAKLWIAEAIAQHEKNKHK